MTDIVERLRLASARSKASADNADYFAPVTIKDCDDAVAEIDRLRSLAAVSAVKDGALTDEVEEAMHDLETWGTAYPTDIFPEPTKEQIDAMIAVTAPADGVSRVAAANARHLYKVRGPKLIGLIRRLSASYSAACGERDTARAQWAGDNQKLLDAANFVAKEAARIDGDVQFLKVPREAIGLLRITLALIEDKGL